LRADVGLVGELGLKEAQVRATQLKERRHGWFEITHATLGVGCHECAADDHVVPAGSHAHNH